MIIWQKLLIILTSILQAAGISNKTYSIWRPKPTEKIKRKGHPLNNPTEKQISDIFWALLRKTRIEQWRIENNCYPSKWPKRPLKVIDTIVVACTDSPSWNSADLYHFDISDKNTVTPERPLPGISYHIFINSSGIIEKTAEYEELISHTRGKNTRSIGVVIQYQSTGNNSAPNKRVITGLEKILTILCMEFKLNPYKAIIGQRESKWNKVPFFKGHKNLLSVSPGTLISLDELRRSVAIQVKRKLIYAEGFSEQVDDNFDKACETAMNNFKSSAIKLLYSTLTPEKYKYKEYD